MAEQAEEGHQQHPLKIYLWIWILLFILSTMSYMVDYLQFQGLVRWTLILIFMVLKAGFIIAIFMHMAWERMCLITAILVPPICLLVLIGLMNIEGEYTTHTRTAYFDEQPKVSRIVEGHGAHQTHEDAEIEHGSGEL